MSYGFVQQKEDALEFSLIPQFGNTITTFCSGFLGVLGKFPPIQQAEGIYPIPSSYPGSKSKGTFLFFGGSHNILWPSYSIHHRWWTKEIFFPTSLTSPLHGATAGSVDPDFGRSEGEVLAEPKKARKPEIRRESLLQEAGGLVVGWQPGWPPPVGPVPP